MSRNLGYKLIGGLVVLAAAVLWLLSILMPEQFGFFNLAWAGVVLAGGLGIVVLLNGIFQKNIGTVKKFKIIIAVCLFIVALLCLVSALALPGSIVLPIIAIIATVGLLLGILATGGKKWDEGDNHQGGYKNYFERKKEEEDKE